VVRLLSIALFLTLSCTACKEVGADKLYALHLAQAPTAVDWERALPRFVTVRGGQPHKADRLGDIDGDTVHTSTASCHHGSSLPDPLDVDLRAFYTDDALYLRVAWDDPTRDDTFHEWRYDGATWSNGQEYEDGLGLMFDATGSFPRFTCSYACHMDDFGVTASNFHAKNRMKLARDDTWLDLWHWKSQRTGRFGFADDRVVTQEGMAGDVPGELFRDNSLSAVSGREEPPPFGDGDVPLVDYEGEPVADRFLPPGTRAPGSLTDSPNGSRSDVVSLSRWEGGRWIVVLRRALSTSDRRDTVFVPGDERGVNFGVAIMDFTLREHYASNTDERLVLLAADRTGRE